MYKATLTELSRALNEKKISSLELTQLFLNRIHALDTKLNSFISITSEYALAQAKMADAKRSQGESHPLLGIPLAHKDIFCTQGIKTSCGSRMLDQFIAPYDASVVTRLSDAGMVMLGKTNMDEFAMGSSNETSFYGAVKNPWDLARVPGGSSGGSAAAVAARLAPCATATDTGGSIRQPAALSNLTGLKPTYGRVSRYGMIAFASSLDQAGTLTASAEDAALMLQTMAGFDEKDSTSVDVPVPNYMEALQKSLQGMTVGLPKEYFSDQLDPAIAQLVENAIKTYESLGVRFKTISLPHTALSVPAYYVIAPAECSSNLARYDGIRFGHQCENPKDLMDLYERSRSEGFGSETKRRIMIGSYVLSAGYFDAYYLQAQKIRRLIYEDFKKAFQEVDLILSPASPCTAFKIGEKSNDPVSMYLSDIFTIAVNLAGLPGAVIPAGFINGLPMGVQLISPWFQEEKLLQCAHQFQLNTNWHQQCPEGF